MKTNKFYLLLISGIFLSCSNNSNKEYITNLKKENDSLREIISTNQNQLIDKIFIMHTNHDNRVIGTIAEYSAPITEYMLIRKNKNTIDTLIHKSTEPFIRLKENNEIFKDTLTEYELHFKNQEVIMHAVKVN